MSVDNIRFMDRLKICLGALPNVELDDAPINELGGFTVINTAADCNAGVLVSNSRVTVAMDLEDARSMIVSREGTDVVLEVFNQRSGAKDKLSAYIVESQDDSTLVYYKAARSMGGAKRMQSCLMLITTLFAHANGEEMLAEAVQDLELV